MALTLSVVGGDDSLTGGGGNDRIDGGIGNDTLTGDTGNNVLIGDTGADSLEGEAGNDTMTGGVGQDYFVFNTAPAKAGINRITDFSVVDDTIVLDRLLFEQVFGDAANVLPATNFIKGAAALTPNQHIVYNGATSALFYDADGSGAALAKQFATPNPNLALTAAELPAGVEIAGNWGALSAT